MDTIKLRRYQERLLSRRHDLVSTLLRLGEENREANGERYFDWVDQAWEESESRLLDRLAETYMEEMEKIRSALGRMVEGTYGLCRACRRPIEERRLDIFPAAEFCSECQDTRETFERV